MGHTKIGGWICSVGNSCRPLFHYNKTKGTAMKNPGKENDKYTLIQGFYFIEFENKY